MKLLKKGKCTTRKSEGIIKRVREKSLINMQ